MYSRPELERRIDALVTFASKSNVINICIMKKGYSSYTSEANLPTGPRSTFNTPSDNRRFVAVLDSLANLSISRAHGEVHPFPMSRQLQVADCSSPSRAMMMSQMQP